MNISLFLKNILFVSLASVIYAQNAQEFMIPFDDGIKFHTAILTPDTTNKYPVVVYRTPYANKKETLDSVKKRFKHFTDNGYICYGNIMET